VVIFKKGETNMIENSTGIKDLIYEVRGKQVMLDSDVAYLYGYETKRINETVRRNIARFPQNFCFQLTKEEHEFIRCKIFTLNNDDLNEKFLRSQTATLKLEKSSGKHKKYLPYVFTEQGIAMLSGLLKNDIAIEVSISIMNAFVEMRKFINENADIFRKIITMEDKFVEYDEKFELVFDELQRNKIVNQKLFFDGEIYDAYSLLIDIIGKANKRIVIIDNYIDKTIFDILSYKNKNVEVILITKNVKKLDVEKYNSQYGKVEIIISDKFHDRFIIIDNKELYHVGASLKDLGNKCFGLSKIEDKEYLQKILNYIDINK